MVNANPDTAERIGEIRQALHRVRDLDRIAARIADPQVRERIRGVYVDAVPAIGRLDLAQEKHFERMIAGIRMTLDRSESYEADLDRLAVLVDTAIQGGATTDAPSAAPEDPAPPPLAGAPATPAAPAPHTSPEPDAQSIPPSSGASLQLFRSTRPVPATFLPALLAPPPQPEAPVRALVSWLSGERPGPRGLAIAIEESDGMPALADLEIDLRADPASFLKTRGVKPPVDPVIMVGYGDRLHDMAISEGFETDPSIDSAIVAACERAIERLDPDQPAQLAAVRARLEIGVELRRCFAAVVTLEREFLAETDRDAEPPQPQWPYASIHPERALRPGDALDRAFTCHLVAGYPMDAALAVGILEFRQAQVLRLAGGWDADWTGEDFDENFFAHCRQGLDRYMMEPEPMPEP